MLRSNARECQANLRTRGELDTPVGATFAVPNSNIRSAKARRFDQGHGHSPLNFPPVLDDRQPPLQYGTYPTPVIPDS